MIEALWSVEFISNLQGFGARVAIFETGRIFGGDSLFFYVGSYQLQGVDDSLTATIKVTHYRGLPLSIIGPRKEFTVQLSGKPAMPFFDAEGHIMEDPSIRILVRLTHRATLP